MQTSSSTNTQKENANLPKEKQTTLGLYVTSKEAYELWGNKGYTHGWVMEPIMKKIVDLKTSMATYRNIKPGEDFKGYEK